MAGAEVGVQLGSVELLAGIKASIDGQTQNLKALTQHMQRERARARVPAEVRQFASVTIPSGAPRTAVNLGGPDAGFFWLLRRLTIGGLTVKTTAAGTAEAYVSALTGNQGAITGPIVTALGLNDVVDLFSTLPAVHFYSNEQVILQAAENLMVVFDSATAAQQYNVAAQFEVWRTISDPGTWTVD